MNLVGSVEQDIYLSQSIVNTDDFKDWFVDKLLENRDLICDKFGVMPLMAMSLNSFTWLKRLFMKDSAWVETTEGTSSFWLMNIVVLDMRNGLFDFYIDNGVEYVHEV